MNGKFTRELEVGARAITPNGRLAPSDMFDLLQETATAHSDALGYDFQYFMDEKKGWTLLNWRAEILRLPKWRERITVETWPTKGRGLVANRNFRILDERGIPVMKATSQWVYFDLVRRRPVKISSEMLAAYSTDIEDILPPGKVIIEEPDESAKIGGGRFTARRSHTDSNFHVNNVAYIKWAEDDLPDEIFYSGRIRNILVNYRKEAACGVEMFSTVYKAGENCCKCFIKDADGSAFVEIMFLCENNAYEGN